MFRKNYSSSNTYTDYETGVTVHADLGVQVYFDAPVSYVNGYAVVFAAPAGTSLPKFDRFTTSFLEAGWVQVGTGNVDYTDTETIRHLIAPFPHLNNLSPVTFKTV